MSNPLHHRWLAIALLLLSLIVVCFVIFVPLLNTWIDYHDQKNDLAFRLQRQQTIVARKDAVAENLELLNGQFQEQNYFSNSTTEALASAELQNTIKTVVTDSGAQLTSTQGLPGKTENDFLRVTVKVRMTGNIESLRATLFNIETAVPLLIIDQLDITPMRGPRNRANNKIDPSTQLNISFQVVSFMRAKSS